MPETEEEMLSILYEFDDRVHSLEEILQHCLYKTCPNLITDSEIRWHLNSYKMLLGMLQRHYDFIDKHMKA